MKQWFSAAMVLVCLLYLPLVCWAEEAREQLAPGGKAVLLMEETTGQVLYAFDEKKPVAPASITKIMGLILVAEQLESGALLPDEKLTCSAYAKTMGGSEIWLKEGEQMTVEDLVKAVVIASANDAMVVLAEKIGGTEEGFVDLMNQKAAAIGAQNTHFVNCVGFDEEGHVTTAEDIAKMARELLRHPKVTKYCTVWMDSLRDGKTQLVNTNRLVRFYDGTTGLKTGTTDAAGHCLCATAKRGDLSLIAVVMGCSTGEERFDGARQLLDFGFSQYALYQPKPPQLKEVEVNRGVLDRVAVKVQPPQAIVLTKEQAAAAEEEVLAEEQLTAPVQEGQKLGEVRIVVQGEAVAAYPVVAAQEVPQRTWGKAIGMLAHTVAAMA